MPLYWIIKQHKEVNTIQGARLCHRSTGQVGGQEAVGLRYILQPSAVLERADTRNKRTSPGGTASFEEYIQTKFEEWRTQMSKASSPAI